MKIYKNHAALRPDHDLDPPSTQCHDIHDHVQLSDKRQRMAGPSYAAHDTSYDPYTTNHGTFIIYAILLCSDLTVLLSYVTLPICYAIFCLCMCL